MLLYNSPPSGNCYKVRLLLAHLGLEYETLDVSVAAESNAILWYLGDGTRYVPTVAYDRARVLQWQFFEH